MDKVVYDVFISFKNKDENNQSTKDSVIAEKLYKFLKGKGLRVFFSNAELEKRGKARFAKTINEALDASRFLVAVGCSQTNLNSEWVEYEWDSFLNEIRSGIKPNAEVYMLYQDMQIKDLPYALRQQQSFDAAEKDSFEQLYRFIKSAMGADGGNGLSDIRVPPEPIGTSRPTGLRVPPEPKPKVWSHTGEEYNGFKVIQFGGYEWMELDQKDGKALLLSKYVLEMMPFHNTKDPITWKDCSLREYLNSNFYSAFASADREAISLTQNSTSTKVKFSIFESEHIEWTSDFVFLLGEYTMFDYFPGMAVSKMAIQDDFWDAQVEMTLHAWENVTALAIHDDRLNAIAKDGKVNRQWWLRTPGTGFSCSAFVINSGGRSIILKRTHKPCGVRPALWLYLD